MAALKVPSTELPSLMQPHSAIICGQTGCGKTVFILDLLERQYLGVFEHIVIICPTLEYNKAYRERSWIESDGEVYIVDQCDQLHDTIRDFYTKFKGQSTLYIIDDCSASQALTKKKDMLSELAFSGRHAKQSVWVLTQKFNSVLTDLREQTQWVALFHCKDRDSFDGCLRENDAIPKEERAAIRAQLASRKYAKLIIQTAPPSAYCVID